MTSLHCGYRTGYNGHVRLHCTERHMYFSHFGSGHPNRSEIGGYNYNHILFHPSIPTLLYGLFYECLYTVYVAINNTQLNTFLTGK